MQLKLIEVGALLIIVGIIMHFVPPGMLPKIGWHPIKIPGYIVAISGALLVIAGLLLT